MILRNDDALRGVDDFVAEIALARRARRRNLANTSPLCWRRFTHPRPADTVDERGHVVVDTCECLLLGDHDGEHDIERIVCRLDPDGREHYATRPLA